VNAVFAVFDIKIAAEPFVSEEELKLVLSGAAKSGQVDSGEKEMIQNVLDMSETPVREVMTPLVRVVGVEQSTSLVELQKIWRTHRFSGCPSTPTGWTTSSASSTPCAYWSTSSNRSFYRQSRWSR
jgi:CBS domain containing-hemolysin-like protein